MPKHISLLWNMSGFFIYVHSLLLLCQVHFFHWQGEPVLADVDLFLEKACSFNLSSIWLNETRSYVIIQFTFINATSWCRRIFRRIRPLWMRIWHKIFTQYIILCNHSSPFYPAPPSLILSLYFQIIECRCPKVRIQWGGVLCPSDGVTHDRITHVTNVVA